MTSGVELIDGERDDPVVARDSEGLADHFGYNGQVGRN